MSVAEPQSSDPDRRKSVPAAQRDRQRYPTFSTNASYWRIIMCPAGPGHVLYLKSELTSDRWRIYSDNIAMARWLQSTVQGMLNAELSDQSIPVTEARRSYKEGDPRYVLDREAILGARRGDCADVVQHR